MSKYTRECIVCGTHYEYCVQCSKFSHLEPWHTSFHNSTCKNLFKICSDFAGDLLTVDEAKEKLSKLNIPNHVAKHIQRNLDKIFADTNLNKVETNIIQETPEPTEVQPSPATEELKVEEVAIEVSEEPKLEETPVEQLSSVKGFRKRRLERQKQNEEN